MAEKVGKFCKVTVGAVKVLGMGKWSLSGLTRETLDTTEFGDDIDTFVYGKANAGELTIDGNYDPANTSGQPFLDSACENASLFTGGDIKVYIDSTSYMTVDTGGNMLVTKCKAISVDKNGLATTGYTFKLSGGKPILL